MLSEHIGMHQMLTLEYFEFIFFITQRTGLSKYAKKFVKSNKSTITISKKNLCDPHHQAGRYFLEQPYMYTSAISDWEFISDGDAASDS